jgi:periplasmic divalent cation tolerance protein
LKLVQEEAMRAVLIVFVAMLAIVLQTGGFNQARRALIRATLGTMASSADGDYCVAYVTTSGEQEAGKLAEGLVGEKLVACVNIIPQIRSVYTWQGKVEDSKESLMMMKTKCKLMPQVIQYVQANHSYSVAECISVKIDQGSTPYLNWISENTKP